VIEKRNLVKITHLTNVRDLERFRWIYHRNLGGAAELFHLGDFRRFSWWKMGDLPAGNFK